MLDFEERRKASFEEWKKQWGRDSIEQHIEPIKQHINDTRYDFHELEPWKQELMEPDSKKEALIVNLFAGPGAGKSTLAAHAFSLLKYEGINCELVTEYAKTRVWKEDHNTLKDQIYVFAKQRHKLIYLKNKVDVVITDSPILLSLVYGDTSDSFKVVVIQEHLALRNLNIWVDRVKPYKTDGRNQNEDEALSIDNALKEQIPKIPDKLTHICSSMSGAEDLASLIIKTSKDEK